ncbi:dermonecrotic toxin domain-containing protein [Pseudomonas fluorescens]|uniref:dermonecrotic toxin domain-containing protein n=1 Tax=Pseudomonas fluorescens TaxID=294 RepID=UPI001BEA9041|nr:DUF6543 domain-containing protein [Pseudomonas fluorescens]MBT2373909.1 hypothetical protein [Pseudomonas fluorescens]
MARLAKSLVALIRQQPLSAQSNSAEAKVLNAHTETFMPLAALATSTEQSGVALTREVASLLKRQGLGGPPVTPHEEKSSIDKLDAWNKSASSTFKVLYTYASTSLDTLQKQAGMSAPGLAEAFITGTRETVGPDSHRTGNNPAAQNMLRSAMAQVWNQSVHRATNVRADSGLNANSQVHSLMQTPVHKLAQALMLLITPSADTAGHSDVQAQGVRQSRAVSSVSRFVTNQLDNLPSTVTPGAPGVSTGGMPEGLAPKAETAQAQKLLTRLYAEQKHMVSLQSRIPSASEVMQEGFTAWLTKTFPTADKSLPSGWQSRLSVHTWEEKDGVLINEKTVPLTDLFKRAVVGEPVTPFSRIESQGEIVHMGEDGNLSVPSALNRSGAKATIESLFDHAPGTLSGWFATSQDAFWNKPLGLKRSPDLTPAGRLKWQSVAQLRDEAALRKDDGTLSAEGLKTVQAVLTSPNPRERAQGTTGPGIYMLREWGSANGKLLHGAFVLTDKNWEDSDTVVLWRPGAPLAEFKSVQAMRDWLQLRDQNLPRYNPVTPEPVTENLFELRVKDLRVQQKESLRKGLGETPATGKTIEEHLNKSADAGRQLDLYPVIQGRQKLKDAELYRQWLVSQPHPEAKQAWHAVRKDYVDLKAKLTAQTKEAPGSMELQPEKYGNSEEVRKFAREQMMKALGGQDPDKIYLSFTVKKPDGYMLIPGFNESEIGRGSPALTPLHKPEAERMSLTDWSLRNADYTQKVGFFRNFSYNDAKLVDEKGQPVTGLSVKDVVKKIRETDVGGRYAEHLKKTLLDSPAGQVSADNYAQLRQSGLKMALQSTIINDGGIKASLPQQKWVEEIIKNPTSEKRQLVDGQEIAVRPLRVGSSIGLPEGIASVRGVWLVQPATGATSNKVVVITPDAPDGLSFRVYNNVTEMKSKLAQTPQMQAYLAGRVASAAQAETIQNNKAQWVTWAPEEKGNFLKTEYADGVQFSTEQIWKHATSRMGADSKVTTGIVYNAADMVLSNLPVVSVPYSLAQMGVSVFRGHQSLQAGDSAAAQQHFDEAFERLWDVLPSPKAKVSDASVLAKPLTHLPDRFIPGGTSTTLGSPGVSTQPNTPVLARMPESGVKIKAVNSQDEIGIYRGPEIPQGSDGVPAEVTAWKAHEEIVARLKDGEGSMGPGGRTKSRDPVTGKDYLKLNGDYYLSDNQYGTHVIYKAGDITHPRVVEVVDGKLVVRPEGNQGAGGMLNWFRGVTETPAQKRNTALQLAYLIEEGTLGQNRRLSPYGKSTLESLPDELASQILDKARAKVNASSVDDFNRILTDVQQGELNFSTYKEALLELKYAINLWPHIENMTDKAGAKFKISFDPESKLKLHETLFEHKKNLVDASGNPDILVKYETDKSTGLQLILMASDNSRNKTVVERILTKKYELDRLVENQARKEIMDKLLKENPGQENNMDALIKKHNSLPESRAEFSNLKRSIYKREKERQNIDELTTILTRNKILYVIVRQDKSNGRMHLSTEDNFNNFNNAIGKNTLSQEVVPVTKAQTNKTSKIPGSAADTNASAIPGRSKTVKTFQVTIGDLAATQMSYTNFPDAAKARVKSIMDDVSGGRELTKRIGQHYWEDVPQLSPSDGRGAWRAAFSRDGTTWTLQGFYDYHQNRPPIAWGQ